MGSCAALVYIFFGAVGADDNSLDYQQDEKQKMNACAHGLTSPTHTSSIIRMAPPHAHVKATIPRALREQVWLRYAGRQFERRCYVSWCTNRMTVFDFHAGHDIPESKGGSTDISNLRPICSRCNVSMGSQYSICEWERLSGLRPNWNWNWRWRWRGGGCW